MKYFLQTLAGFTLFLLVPILLLLAAYFYDDPFKVVYKYADNSLLELATNRDYVSTELFLQNRERHAYDSFVFGSSRTYGLNIESWRSYLPVGSSPFMFDASSESMYGMHKKIRYLDSVGSPISNAIIMVCRDCSFERSSNHKGHLFIKHPCISGESRLLFQKEFVAAFLNPVVFGQYYWYRATGNQEFNIIRKIAEVDSITNNHALAYRERAIADDSQAYYSKLGDVFYERRGETVDANLRVKDIHMAMMCDIKRIFDKHHTHYKIVVNPSYDQVKINSEDLSCLQTIFGKEFVYDFTGKNNLTESKTKYYEDQHYRPMVGDSILRKVYGE